MIFEICHRIPQEDEKTIKFGLRIDEGDLVLYAFDAVSQKYTNILWIKSATGTMERCDFINKELGLELDDSGKIKLDE